MNIFFIILAAFLGFYVGRTTKKAPVDTPEIQTIAHKRSKEALNERTENRKEEILEMMENARERHEELKACNLEEERKGVNRRDVEELLEVSGQTALKYLNELEDEGYIRQVGVGKDIYYMLNG